MAKKSWMAREQKRRRMVKKYAAKRQELKEKGDWEGLQKLPRNASPVRLNNRCPLTGRRSISTWSGRRSTASCAASSRRSSSARRAGPWCT